MQDLLEAFRTALRLIVELDAELVEIVGLSLRVSLSAVLLATLVGLPLGALVGMLRFPGRRVVTVLLNSLLGLPPVVVGLLVYLLLSRSGPFGALGLLFTPAGMVIAQFVLITPIVAALSRQVLEDLWEEYEDQLRSLGAGVARAIPTLLFEGRYRLRKGHRRGRRGDHRRRQHRPRDSRHDHGHRPRDEPRRPPARPGAGSPADRALDRGQRRGLPGAGGHAERPCLSLATTRTRSCRWSRRT
jgi:ABC-type tungstate transport system substrate-binding protein